MLLTLVLLLSIPQIRKIIVFKRTYYYNQFHNVCIYNISVTQYYQYGDISIVGGPHQWEGRVEIYLSGIWGTITDSDWTNEDAAVVCRKLGYITQGHKKIIYRM